MDLSLNFIIYQKRIIVKRIYVNIYLCKTTVNIEYFYGIGNKLIK